MGCGVLVERGRCAAHQKQQQQQADSTRGNSAERGYTWRWRKARESWLRSHPLCGDRHRGSSDQHSLCLQQGRVSAAHVVDHIVPHKGDDDLFWNSDNWQSLCTDCHNMKTAREDGGFGNKYKGGGAG
jgi:5-methylcytosine-specific restriction protein A